MNWNFLKRWKERREQRRRLKELQAFAGGFKTMDQMEDKGLLAWNMKQRQLFIDSSLAYVMMARGAETWKNFVNNVYLWQYSKECERAWADFFLKEELKAVRDYKSQHRGTVVTRADVNRIREARRMEILQSDMEAPKIKGFEFFIVAPPKLDTQDSPRVSSSPVGELVAVGHYEPDTEQMEMATWEEVRYKLGIEN